MSDIDKDQSKGGRKSAAPGPAAGEDAAGRPTADSAAAGSNSQTNSAANSAGSATAASPRPGAAARASTARADSDHGLGEREVQYMITPRRSAGLSTLAAGPFGAQSGPDMGRIQEALQSMPNVKVVRRIQPSAVSVLSAGMGVSSDILVVRTKAEDNQFLAGLAHPGLIIERDYLLAHLGVQRPAGLGSIGVRPLNVMMNSTTLQFHVEDTGGSPLRQTHICLYTNAGGEAIGITDEGGNASITVNSGYINDIIAIYVKPFANCWEFFASRPALQQDGVNSVILKKLSDFAPARFVDPVDGAGGFCGWGQRLMGLDKVSIGQATGHGVKVAIIDSGCDNTHPALSHVRIGRDYTNLDDEHLPNQQSWSTDTMSHGTHCAGVIAGNGSNGHIRGFVPQAEVHSLKLFPGGAFNNLAAALHYCIDNQIDVVNCSLGGDQTSEAIQQVVETARQAGVAVVVAAGNSSGPIQFPANIPGVFCITAIGEQGEYPDNTYHAQTLSPGVVGSGGLFPAKFSCTGAQVSFCAPGVAIISSVPGGGYAAWDGTSMAAPAITGLLAMVLAHHPEFAGKPAIRSAQRVDRLFQIVAQAAAPVGLPPQQAGAGLPRVSSGPMSGFADADTHIQGAVPAGQITQAQLEEIVRSAFMSSLGSFGGGARPPAG